MANTPHIGLHQWQPNDNFLREEFNGDFAKIDTAIKNLEAAMPRVLLKKHTTTVAAQQVDISLTGIRFEDYWSLDIYLSSPAATNLVTFIRFNGRAAVGDYYHKAASSSSSDESIYFVWVQLGPACAYLTLDCGGRSVSGKYRVVGESNHIFSAFMPASKGVNFSNLNLMNIVGSSGGSLPAGTEITIYGVRK